MRKLGPISAVAFALFLSGLLAAAATESPRALFPTRSHDFGTVTQGAKIVREFTVRNQGTNPLTIEGGELSMPGMKARFNTGIGPGEEARITLEWDTSGVRGEVRGEAGFRLNDPAQPTVTLSLSGVVKLPIEIRPFAAVFFSIWKGESAERSVTIVNNEERPLNILGLKPDGKHFVASLQTVEPGKIYDLLVKIPPETPPGRYTEAVYLESDHPALSRLRIAVNVLVKTEIYTNPEVVDFGVVSLAQLARAPSLLELLTQTLVVRKRLGEFEITAIVSAPSVLHITQAPIGRSGTFRIDVGLAREKLQPGTITGSIHVQTNDKDFPSLVIPVRGEVKP